MAEEYKTITFYKYHNVGDTAELRGYIRRLCEALNLKGRILIGKEGINAGISGLDENIEIFKKTLTKKRPFAKLTFREQVSSSNTYHKLVVRIRPEIVALGLKDINPDKKAKHVKPERLKKWIDRGEDLIILDARNDYEHKVGKFKNALTLPIKTFKEFPVKVLDELKGKEDKKIVMYCTGGIRCEKSSAFLKSKGFKNIFRLQGGIINYVNQFPNDNFHGKVFVFDDRLVSETGSEEKLGNCEICSVPCNDYTDCHNLNCDKLFICCESCKEKMNNTCSLECKNSQRLRPKEMVVN